MGLTKQYLAFKPVANFNIVASSRSNVAFVTHNKTDGRFAAVGAAERVVIWDLRLIRPNSSWLVHRNNSISITDSDNVSWN